MSGRRVCAKKFRRRARSARGIASESSPTGESLFFIFFINNIIANGRPIGRIQLVGGRRAAGSSSSGTCVTTRTAARDGLDDRLRDTGAAPLRLTAVGGAKTPPGAYNSRAH